MNSSSLLTKVEKTGILPGYRTDHSFVTLTLAIEKIEKGFSYWKFNNSLLKDICFIDKVKTVINRINHQYAIEVQPVDLPIDRIDDKELLLKNVEKPVKIKRRKKKTN